jgi:uncharacterized protein YvpB
MYDHFDALGTGADPQTLFPEHVTYDPSGHPVLGPAPSLDVNGHPGLDAWDWQWQGTQNGLCGPTSIAMVVNEFGHQPDGTVLTGREVAYWAATHGDMIPDGRPESTSDYGYEMNMEQISATLDHYGVQNQVVQGGSLAMLEGYLRSGHEVILGVDGDRIWHDVPASEDPGRANHAVVLTGIDERTGYAYLNDPGSPDGRMEAVPIRELMSAWSTSGYCAVVTDAVPTNHEAAPTGPGAVILPVVLHQELITLEDHLPSGFARLVGQLTSRGVSYAG